MTRRSFLGSFGVFTSTVTFPVPSAASRQQFSASGGSSTHPDAGCTPGYVIATGALTQDAQSVTFAVGSGFALLPHPDTMAVKRLEELVGEAIELIVRPIKAR